MTSNERIDAAKALCDWFVSQEISLVDSAQIMAKLLGTQIGMVARDEADAAKGLAALVCAIASSTHSTLVRR